MCGVLMVAERGQPVIQTRFQVALAKLRHRGPDASGHRFLTIKPSGTHAGTPADTVAVHVGIGHTRLSIIDLSTASAQPFERQGRWLSYNGEIYNYRQLRQDLQRRGETFHSGGDTEVLAAMLARDGVAGLNAANGMWAFGWLDPSAMTLTAVRDRFGKKPLYYYRDASTLCLASEIAPILAYLGRRPTIPVAGDPGPFHGTPALG